MKATLYSEDRTGKYGRFALQINVDVPPTALLNSDEIRQATDDAVKMIRNAIMENVIKRSPEAIYEAKLTRENIISLFDTVPFVKAHSDAFVTEIPNGYCSEVCCCHLPWFIVLTPVGKIKIGWRKRVLQIEWNETKGTKISSELFQSEDVTKEEKMIHAWSYVDAKRYIETIINSAR